MRYSKLFGKTTKTMPADEKIVSNKLLHQAGYTRESTAGRLFILPLAQRVMQKIMKIVKEEMDRIGAQEMVSPILHPLELWKETNRTSTAGFELMKVKDRRDAEFALGGTAEEMFVDVVRKFNMSYRDLPFHIYQFSPKFRDEMRARGGLLRVREFTMKDGYSFDRNEAEFKNVYDTMATTYSTIFKRVGLQTVKVESDNGYIGGEYCHEFVVEGEVGETKFLVTPDGSYAAHEEVAVFKKPNHHDTEDMKPLKEVHGKGIIGVEALASYLKIPVEKTTKTILFEIDGGRVVAAAIQGQYDINEVKLKNILKTSTLELAKPETVKKVTGAEVGYAGILNLPRDVTVIMDETMKGRRNFEMGANRTDYHTININFGRDIPEPKKYYDIALAKEGYTAPDGKQKLVAKRGIEVGNIFQLGHHYTNLMKGATYVDQDGKEKPYYMGCYGIGIGRTMAAIVETHHDEWGIKWPESVCPFYIHLIGLDLHEEPIRTNVEKIYETLTQKGIDVLFDDRDDVRAGEKFKDADLIGIPHRILISRKTGDKIEYKKRGDKHAKLITLDELYSLV